MPIYEYMCQGCGKSFEVLQGINDIPELSCENCNGSDIERVLSPGAFVFKGSGFYDIFLPLMLALDEYEC